jgi:Mrp family chromosome partitioning ATPase
MSSPMQRASVGPVEAWWRYRLRNLPLCVLLAAAAAFLAFSLGGTSTATSAIYLTDPRGVPIFRDGTTAAADLLTYGQQRAEFVRSDDVLTLAAADLANGSDVQDLRGKVTAIVATGSSITVTCEDASEDIASKLCTSVVDHYQELSRADTQARAQIAIDTLTSQRQELLDELSAAQAASDAAAEAAAAATPAADDLPVYRAPVLTSSAIEQIDVQIGQFRTKAALFDDGVEFVDVPRVAETSRIAPAIQYGIAAFAFGLMITGALSWLAAARRPIVRDPDVAAAELGAPLVGQVADRSTAAGYDLISTNLAAVGTRGVVVLTGSFDGASYSEIAASLAEAWAREGRRVLVIDGNLRRPRLSARFGAGLSSVGLTDLLGGLATEEAAIRRVTLPDGGPSLHFISCGQAVPHAASLLRSTTARAALNKLQERYDIVLIDAPPLMDRAEGSALASVADGVVMVVPEGMPINDLSTVRRRLEVLRSPLLGVIYDLDPR